MKDWIPLFQTLVWPLLLVFILFGSFSRNVREVIDAVRDRIKGGSSFEAGPGGVKLGSVQGERVLVGGVTEPMPVASSKSDNAVVSTKERSVQRPSRLYLVHVAKKDRIVTKAGDPYHQLRIYLDGDPDQDLSRVEKVVYHLHPTFPVPIQTRSDRNNNFEVRTRAWGEFNLWAEVYLTGGGEPIILERYLNL